MTFHKIEIILDRGTRRFLIAAPLTMMKAIGLAEQLTKIIKNSYGIVQTSHELRPGVWPHFVFL